MKWSLIVVPFEGKFATAVVQTEDPRRGGALIPIGRIHLTYAQAMELHADQRVDLVVEIREKYTTWYPEDRLP